MKRAMLLVLVLGLPWSVQAQEKSDRPKQVHLGVEAAVVPAVIHDQLPNLVPKGQGVLIAEVEKDSPAAKAGLRADDILLSYGDQKVHSPAQLVKLVRADKAGHEVNLSFVRGGKQMTCKATLNEIERPMFRDGPRSFRFYPDDAGRKVFDDFDSKLDTKFWDTFDEMKLTRVDDKHWKAEIVFRSKEGQKVTKKFSGTREEIRKDILAEKDLPINERRHLLRALNLHEPLFQFYFSPFDTIPDSRDRP